MLELVVSGSERRIRNNMQGINDVTRSDQRGTRVEPGTEIIETQRPNWFGHLNYMNNNKLTKPDWEAGGKSR